MNNGAGMGPGFRFRPDSRLRSCPQYQTDYGTFFVGCPTYLLEKDRPVRDQPSTALNLFILQSDFLELYVPGPSTSFRTSTVGSSKDPWRP